MNKEGNFGLMETISLTVLIIASKMLYTSLPVVVELVGTAAWYMTIISCITSITCFLLIYLLLKRFPGKNIIQIFEAVLGKVIGKILAIFFAVYILFYAGSSLREFLEMIKAYNLPYTQPSIILASFIAVSVLIAYKGLEAIARVSYLAFFPILSGIIIILVLAYPNYNFNYLKPYFGYGIEKTIYTGILRSSGYQEVFILPIIINSIHGLKNLKKAGLISLIISGVMFSTSALCYLAAFQYNMGSENLSGFFQLARIIYFNRYFQRIESIFLFTWVITSVLTVSISFYISISVYCKAMSVSNHRPLVFPFSFLMFMVALLPRNISELNDVNMVIIRQYGSTFVFGIPILVLLISLVLRKKGVKANEKKA